MMYPIGCTEFHIRFFKVFIWEYFYQHSTGFHEDQSCSADMIKMIEVEEKMMMKTKKRRRRRSRRRMMRMSRTVIVMR